MRKEVRLENHAQLLSTITPLVRCIRPRAGPMLAAHGKRVAMRRPCTRRAALHAGCSTMQERL